MAPLLFAALFGGSCHNTLPDPQPPQPQPAQPQQPLPVTELLVGDVPPRLYSGLFHLAGEGFPAGGTFVPYGAIPPGTQITVLDEHGVIGRGQATGASALGPEQCSSWTFSRAYEVTDLDRPGSIDIEPICREGVSAEDCRAAIDAYKFPPCPNDTCDDHGIEEARMAAMKVLTFPFSTRLVAQGLRLSAGAKVLAPGLVPWSMADRNVYMAIDADEDGKADIVTDTHYLNDAGMRAYDTWVKMKPCEDLAHDDWCRVAHEQLVICGDPDNGR